MPGSGWPTCLRAGDRRRTTPQPRRAGRRACGGGGQDTSTLEDQNELALTVYNSDIALVRDVRTLQLPRGTFDLKFMDIAATVNPATVHFRSLSEPSRVSVLEQNYEYDLLEPDKLLRKYVGRDVTLVRCRVDGGDARGGGHGQAAQLQQGAGLADQRRDRHGPHADHIRFPALPGNLSRGPPSSGRSKRRRGPASRGGLLPGHSCPGTRTTC